MSCLIVYNLLNIINLKYIKEPINQQPSSYNMSFNAGTPHFLCSLQKWGCAKVRRTIGRLHSLELGSGII